MPHPTAAALAAALDAGDLTRATRLVMGIARVAPEMTAAQRLHSAQQEARYLSMLVQTPTRKQAA